MWSESTTAGAQSLLCTLKVPQQNGLKCLFPTFSLELLEASSTVLCHCCHFLVQGSGEAEEISPLTALSRLPADRTLWFSSTPFWVSPGPQLRSKGFSGKDNMPVWMNMFEWSAGSHAEEPDWNRPVLTLPMFSGQVGSVGYWRKCLILTCEKLNLKPTHSGFSGKTIFLGMPVTILGRKQCGNFQIQIKIRCKRREERLEKKRSWQNTIKQVKKCLLLLSPFPSLSSQLVTRKAAFHLNFHHTVNVMQKSTAWK